MEMTSTQLQRALVGLSGCTVAEHQNARNPEMKYYFQNPVRLNQCVFGGSVDEVWGRATKAGFAPDYPNNLMACVWLARNLNLVLFAGGAEAYIWEVDGPLEHTRYSHPSLSTAAALAIYSWHTGERVEMEGVEPVDITVPNSIVSSATTIQLKAVMDRLIELGGELRDFSLSAGAIVSIKAEIAELRVQIVTAFEESKEIL